MRVQVADAETVQGEVRPAEGPFLRGHAEARDAETVQGEVRPAEGRGTDARGAELRSAGVGVGEMRRGGGRGGEGQGEGEGRGERGRRGEGREGTDVPWQEGVVEWDPSSGSSTEVVSPFRGEGGGEEGREERGGGAREASGEERGRRGREGESKSRMGGGAEKQAEGTEEIAAGMKWITIGDDILKKGVAQGVEKLVQGLSSLSHLRRHAPTHTPNPNPNTNPNPNAFHLPGEPQQWQDSGVPLKYGVPGHPPVTAELLSQRLQVAAAYVVPHPGDGGGHPGSASGAPTEGHRGIGGPQDSRNLLQNPNREGGLGICGVAQLIPPIHAGLPALPGSGDAAGGGVPKANAPACRQPGLQGPEPPLQLPLYRAPLSTFSAPQEAEALEALIEGGRPRQMRGGAHCPRDEAGEGQEGGGGILAVRGWAAGPGAQGSAARNPCGQQSFQPQTQRGALIPGVGGSVAFREGHKLDWGRSVSARDEFAQSVASSRQQFVQHGASGQGREFAEAELTLIPQAPSGMAHEVAERDATIVRKRLIRLATAVERGDLVSVGHGHCCTCSWA